MKRIQEMSQIELTAFVQSRLEEENIHVVLSGGAATSYYCKNKYVSGDIDLVNIYMIDRRRIELAIQKIGFREQGRYFIHPESEFLIEFPPGPLTVGLEPVQTISKIKMETGVLKIISATDCIKDRLAAYYHWGDMQCLLQARLVKQASQVDLEEIKRWSIKEGKQKEFEIFLSDF